MMKKYYHLIILLIISISSSEAFIPLNGFWKKRGPSLKFSTVAQSISASNCSAITTVETDNSAGVATNVASNLTVNLSATGSIVFYSDSGCTSSITSVTVATGTSNKSFYFISSATGSPNLTAAATSYGTGSQIETVSANQFIWLGGGGNANWDTAANWSGGAAPGASNIALFDGSCSSNCSPTINANISVGGIRINSGYSDTITQASGVTVTLAASGGYVQLDGSFVGSNSSITDNGIYALGGGTFTSTTGVLKVISHWTILNAPTFNHNNGTLLFSRNGLNIIPGSVTYFNVSFIDDDGNYDLGGNTMNIAGTLTLDDTNNNVGGNGDYGVRNGILSVSGPAVNSVDYGQAGSATIKLVGNAAGQTITGVTNARFPSIEIAAGGNPVTINGVVSIYGNYKLTSASSLTTTGSTLQITSPNHGTSIVTAGSATYNNVTFVDDDGDYDLGGGTMNIAGTVTLNDTNGNIAGYTTFGIENGTLSLSGNFVSTGYGEAGNALIIFTGTANQTITIGANGRIPTGNVTVNKASGSLSLATNVSWNATGQTLTVTTGSMDMAGHNLTAKALSLNSTTITKNSGVLIVNGTTVGTGALYGGTIDP